MMAQRTSSLRRLSKGGLLKGTVILVQELLDLVNGMVSVSQKHLILPRLLRFQVRAFLSRSY